MRTTWARLESAASRGDLSESAVANIRRWLTEPCYADYVSEVAAHLKDEKWKALDDAFWTVIPFGTAGRRGKMYPIGSNAINDRTIGESAQGLADSMKEQFPDLTAGCAIAYDTRHRSRHFAELCSKIMAAAGFTVYFLDGYRSTPELSFAVREKNCLCGIMVTASHNPPCDNAVKVYGPSGGQLLPPYDQGVIDRVMNVEEIHQISFTEGLKSGRIVYCQEEVDAAFRQAVASQSHPGPRELKILYSPLHGVGTSAVIPALQDAGFRDIEVFAPHEKPDGDFPNVPDHVSNPENPAVFDTIIQSAIKTGAELVLATDPDCDRVGCAVPRTLDKEAPWVCLSGNQIGALLADFLLKEARTAGTLTPEHYVVKTLVTTELIRRIADAYGAKTVGDLLVGFKWIGKAIDENGPERFVMGAEESYGFLVGDHARDKDAAVTSMLLAELAAKAKAAGLSLCEKLDQLFERHGGHAERTVSVKMPGAEGMERMKTLMGRFRNDPPDSLAGIKVARVRDYLTQTVTSDGKRRALSGPRGDLIMIDLESEGNYVAVRPSGTEPKVKFYMFTYQRPESGADLDAVKIRLIDRLACLEKDLRTIAGM